jgi:hypothetical protein
MRNSLSAFSPSPCARCKAREQEVDRAVVGIEVSGPRGLGQRVGGVARVEEALGLHVEGGRDLGVAAALARELEGALAALDPLEPSARGRGR